MKRAFLLASFLVSAHFIGATHIRCGYISIKQQGNTLECLITIRVFTNSGSEIRFGEGHLSFGDGTVLMPPIIEGTPRPDLGPNMAEVEYSVLHQYPAHGAYVVSYIEPNRIAGIINFPNSVEARVYLESYFILDPATPSYQSPIFLADPIFNSEINNAYSESIAAVDSNGYRLVYFSGSLAAPIPFTNYQIPESFEIDPYAGRMTWDGDFMNSNLVGPYLFMVRICQYDGDELKGYVLRDFDVTLQDDIRVTHMEDTKDLDEHNRLLVLPGEEDSIKILYIMTDPEAASEIEVYSELTNISGVISYSTYDSTIVATGEDVKVIKLHVASTPGIERDLPYLITVRGRVQHKHKKDITYLLYTRDIDDSALPPDPGAIVTSLSEVSRATQPYPNPVVRYVNIGSADRALIYAANGGLIGKQKPQNETIDLGSLPAGLYLLVLEHKGQQSAAYRLVKQ